MTIVAKQLVKELGDPPTRVIQGVDLTIDDGDFLSISGSSGSGKSTLLYLLSTLDNPTSGQLTIDNENPFEMSVEQLHQFRNLKLGFVFQFHYLLPELTTLENVLLPARRTQQHEVKKAYAEELLSTFGIEDKMHKLPSQMSGGEQQRVAIARAMIMKPRYLFADEPTGSLDSKNSNIVMEILQRANKEWNTTLIMVTHETEFAAMAEKKIFLVDGKIESREG